MKLYKKKNNLLVIILHIVIINTIHNTIVTGAITIHTMAGIGIKIIVTGKITMNMLVIIVIIMLIMITIIGGGDMIILINLYLSN